ncbi:MAG: SLC13 family permease [Candidatus Hodarchaeota archaeon]
MTQIFPIISSLVVFIAVMVIFTKEKMDYVSYTIIGAFAACLITTMFFPAKSTYEDFLNFVEIKPLLFIVAMQIIILISEKHKIFQWISLKVLHFTKGDHRKFFYLISIISCLSAAIVADITIAIVFIPLVIRASSILKVNSAPYCFAISFTVNIGSLYTPFSSSENILIANEFNLSFDWFFLRFTPYLIPVLIATLLLVDFTMLRKEKPPEADLKKLILRVMTPGMVIENKKQFILNFGYFIAVIVGFIVYSEAYIIALIGAVIIALLNKTSFTDLIKKVDWKVLIFLVGIMLVIGTMEINGTFKIIGQVLGDILPENVLLASIILLFVVAVLSGFLAQVPTALVLITLLQNIYGAGNVPNLIIMSFLLGINLGSNFLPQGAAVDLMALELAKKYDVKDFNYKSLLRNGALITFFHIGNSILLMTIYFFTGYGL